MCTSVMFIETHLYVWRADKAMPLFITLFLYRLIAATFQVEHSMILIKKAQKFVKQSQFVYDTELEKSVASTLCCAVYVGGTK